MDSTTQIVVSPGEAVRLAKDSSWLPRSFKGWTCKERAEPKRSPAGGYMDVPDDPCGRRVWSGEAEQEDVPEEHEAPPVCSLVKPKKKPLEVTINRAAWALPEEPEEPEEPDTTNLVEAMNPSLVGMDAPEEELSVMDQMERDWATQGRRETRVQFVEDE
jgi:hypothetical protein